MRQFVYSFFFLLAIFSILSNLLLSHFMRIIRIIFSFSFYNWLCWIIFRLIHSKKYPAAMLKAVCSISWHKILVVGISCWTFPIFMAVFIGSLIISNEEEVKSDQDKDEKGSRDYQCHYIKKQLQRKALKMNPAMSMLYFVSIMYLIVCMYKRIKSPPSPTI